jgi:serine/threonine protein kinase
MDPLIGRTLDNKYLIEKLLGKGGMGSVYQAIHTGTKRVVAVKVIAPQFMRNRELLIRFQREAEASGRLRHPNVVNVTDFGVTVIDVTQVAYLAMEFLDGETLYDLLQRTPLMPPAMAMDILEQIALGVTEAHGHGILHRDLKPQNIWLQPDGRGGYIVKVLDFGIAKLADPSALSMEIPELEAAPNIEPADLADENATQVLAPTEMGLTSAFAEASGFTTTVGATLGTPAFMSPEQCSGMPVSEKSDLYSLAMMAYMMLAGELPFKGNARELIEQQITTTPDAPHSRNSNLSVIISNVILESLAKDPAYRAPDCISFVARLRAAVEGEVNLLKESRQMSGGNSGTWFAMLGAAILPSGMVLSTLRVGVRALMEQGLLEDWQGFLVLLPFHVVIAYLAMVWCDMAMARWTIYLRTNDSSVKAWLNESLIAARDAWQGWKAAVFTTRPLVHGLAHLVATIENKPAAEARLRSEQLTRGTEHMVLALVVRRIAVAFMVALYLPVVMVVVQAPVRIIFREALAGGLGGTMSFASFSFMPIYGAFLIAWYMLYERGRRSLGEEGADAKKRYEAVKGKIGERIRMGTRLWALVPVLLVAVVMVLPFSGWNETFGDSLSLAIREGRVKDIRRLLNEGANPNEGRGPGGDPMFLAVQIGDIETLKLLIAKGAKVDGPPKSSGPLHFAVSRRRPEVVRLLVEAGAKLDAVDDRENSPLLLAAKSGQVEIVRYLLARGANPALTDTNGRTALEEAKRQGYAEVIQVLEQK